MNKNIMKQNIVRGMCILCRNGIALFKRLVRAYRAGDEAAILKATVNLLEEAMWLFCIVMMLTSIVAGFFRPHCFFVAGMFFFVAVCVRTNIEDRRDYGADSVQ